MAFLRFKGLRIFRKTIMNQWVVSAIALCSLGLMLTVGSPDKALATNPYCQDASTSAAVCLTTAQTTAPTPTTTAAQTTADFETSVLQEYVQVKGAAGISAIFTIFFLTLGPLKIVPTFASLTAHADDKLRSQMAWRSTLIATATVVLTALLGVGLLEKYGIPVTALTMAAGIVLFMVALKIVLTQYGSAAPPPSPPENPSLNLVVTPLTFPTILTPYGIAVVMIIMSIEKQLAGNISIVLGLLLLIMLLNLLAMLFADGILKVLKPSILKVLGLVLGIIQLALGISWILAAIRIEALAIQKLLSL